MAGALSRNKNTSEPTVSFVSSTQFDENSAYVSSKRGTMLPSSIPQASSPTLTSNENPCVAPNIAFVDRKLCERNRKID